MLCSRVARNSLSATSKRVGTLCRGNIKRLQWRGYTSSNFTGAAYTISPLLKWTLTGAGIASALYLVFPFKKNPPKQEEPKSEPQAEPEPQPQPEEETEAAPGKLEGQQETEQEPVHKQELQKKQEGVEVQKHEHVQQQQEQQEDSDRETNQNETQDQSQEPKSQSRSENKENEIEYSESEKHEQDTGNTDQTREEPTKENTVTSTDGHQPGKNLKSDAELQSFAEEQLGEKDKEASQEGAYNPDTGEINWDCPCLGGMAHGPCGEEFKDAFSCFVYSEAEPKGIDCVEKFQNMQDCFRKHPEHYAEQIKDEEEATSATNANSESAKSEIADPSDLSSNNDKKKGEEIQLDEKSSKVESENDAT
ncbi:hypothetical protein HG535_0B07000 [Zygotorulaspora mrakii]|uniref:Mitochondrial intermembrane space import and assembly protein 40 n=1 Tax=Zygotorulaspora mrakii TaxID=42260 RepID=A0A7H9AZY8_ZYGMR|nr:uncharacterized protein HG535_0B07000 [Zygotorulaspora mrakii]QLG71654.1 hypothetical protein HG535_0B07000 [Zygotorulaspora mrakii]